MADKWLKITNQKKKKKFISLGHFENYQLYNNFMKVCNDIEK
jgi:hypothetical protein